jgi:four helix bundle protein
MQDLLDRTKRMAIDIVKYCCLLPQKQEYHIISKQLIRCATSVGANYRAARRGKSTLDFIAKLSIVEEEADESLYWMELLKELGCPQETQLYDLYREMNEITSIIVASKITAKKKQTC